MTDWWRHGEGARTRRHWRLSTDDLKWPSRSFTYCKPFQIYNGEAVDKISSDARFLCDRSELSFLIYIFSLFCTLSKIPSLIYQNLKRSRDHEHAPFRIMYDAQPNTRSDQSVYINFFYWTLKRDVHTLFLCPYPLRKIPDSALLGDLQKVVYFRQTRTHSPKSEDIWLLAPETEPVLNFWPVPARPGQWTF